ncbi:MAG: YtxH domain-containing protein [Chitinophagaceae bacterium]|nr:YtxH domain-containing protein [Chitinophagaceae bacterium]
MKWLIGIAAGAAVIYFLQTDKGKELINTVSKQAGGLGDSLSSLLKSGETAVKTAAENMTA